MRSIASSLALLAAPAIVLASGAGAPPGPEAKPSPEPASSVATVWTVRPPQAPPAVPAPPAPAPAPGPARAHVVPSPAVVEKLGKGDRFSLAGDHRNALFVYQDAVYMQPAYAPARVRLGRAHLVLGYPAQAVAQAEAALAADPGSEEARTLLDEASTAPSRPPVSPPARDPGGPPPGPPPVR
jgi:hypothetical protein